MHLIPARHRVTALVAGVMLAVVAAACGPAPATPASAPVEPASAGPTFPADPLAEPPTAMLAVEGGDPVAGALGSYTWGDVGSGGPWLPGTPITVGAGETATVSVDQRLPITAWRARVAAAPDGSLANGLSSGGPPIAFGVPGPGAWTIEVTIDFRDGIGQATYYWRMTVT